MIKRDLRAVTSKGVVSAPALKAVNTQIRRLTDKG
jgi:hypothetical protein